MSRTKFLISMLIVSLLLLSQVVAAGAAPLAQETTPITGTVQEVTITTDETTGETSVLVTLVDEMGATQTVRLSVSTAIALGLVTDDGSGPVVNDEAIGEPVEIDPEDVLPEPTDGIPEEAQHPVGSALSDFFSELLGVDYDTIMAYHDNGVGFGVIAQALWMTNNLEGDTEMFSAILEARQSGDYSGITLPDGSTPTNWGQFKKAVRNSPKENLGAIMSGHADNNQDEMEVDVKDNSRSPGEKGNGKDKDKGNGKDKDKENNGKGKNK